MLYLLLLIYFILSTGVAYLGADRSIGFGKAFLFSILLTPIMGLTIVAHSSKKITYFEIQFHCPRCGYNFTEKHEFCPYCHEKGLAIPLIQETVTTT
jgi:hypothetical protein